MVKFYCENTNDMLLGGEDAVGRQSVGSVGWRPVRVTICGGARFEGIEG